MRKLVLETPPPKVARVFGTLLLLVSPGLLFLVARPSGLPEIWGLSLLPVFVGVVVLCARSFWFVDAQSGSVWRATFVPRGGRLLARGVSQVRLWQDTRIVDGGNRYKIGEVYPVTLLPAGREVDAGQDPGAARQLAAALALGLRVPLRDDLGPS